MFAIRSPPPIGFCLFLRLPCSKFRLVFRYHCFNNYNYNPEADFSLPHTYIRLLYVLPICIQCASAPFFSRRNPRVGDCQVVGTEGDTRGSPGVSALG